MRDCALFAMLERRKIAIVAAIAAVASAKGRGAPSGAPSAADAEKKKVTDELMNWVKGRVQLLPRAEAGRCEVRAPLGRV